MASTGFVLAHVMLKIEDVFPRRTISSLPVARSSIVMLPSSAAKNASVPSADTVAALRLPEAVFIVRTAVPVLRSQRKAVPSPEALKSKIRIGNESETPDALRMAFQKLRRDARFGRIPHRHCAFNRPTGHYPAVITHRDRDCRRRVTIENRDLRAIADTPMPNCLVRRCADERLSIGAERDAAYTSSVSLKSLPFLPGFCVPGVNRSVDTAANRQVLPLVVRRAPHCGWMAQNAKLPPMVDIPKTNRAVPRTAQCPFPLKIEANRTDLAASPIQPETAAGLAIPDCDHAFANLAQTGPPIEWTECQLVPDVSELVPIACDDRPRA